MPAFCSHDSHAVCEDILKSSRYPENGYWILVTKVWKVKWMSLDRTPGLYDFYIGAHLSSFIRSACLIYYYVRDSEPSEIVQCRPNLLIK